jgi:hypothetical protein
MFFRPCAEFAEKKPSTIPAYSGQKIYIRISLFLTRYHIYLAKTKDQSAGWPPFVFISYF